MGWLRDFRIRRAFKRLESLKSRAQESGSKTLLRLADAAVSSRLASLLEDENRDSDLREVAARVLGGIGDATAAVALARAYTRLLELEKNYRDDLHLRWTVKHAIEDMGAQPFLSQLEERPSATICIALANAIGLSNDTSAGDSLADLISVPACRATAVGALGQLRDGSRLEQIMAVLTDTDVQSRKAAAEALGRIGDPRATAILLERLDDPSEHTDVRCAAAEAVGCLGDAGSVPHLVRAWQGPDEALHYRVVDALVELGIAAAAEPLITFLGDPRLGQVSIGKSRIETALGQFEEEADGCRRCRVRRRRGADRPCFESEIPNPAYGG